MSLFRFWAAPWMMYRSCSLPRVDYVYRQIYMHTAPASALDMLFKICRHSMGDTGAKLWLCMNPPQQMVASVS